MFNTALVKMIISQAAGMSSAFVVKGIIRNNVHPETKFEIAQTWLGSFAIGGLVSERVMTNTRKNLDEIEEFYNKHKGQINPSE